MPADVFATTAVQRAPPLTPLRARALPLLLCRREQQRAAQLELKIAEMTDRAKDFETMKGGLMQRVKEQDLEVQRLKRENDQVRFLECEQLLECGQHAE